MKKILLQCQSLTYLYNALAAIYTKYPNRDVIVDVLFVSAIEDYSGFLNQIKPVKYINNIFSISFKSLYNIIHKIIKLENNIYGFLKFNLCYKRRYLNLLKNHIGNEIYDEIYFSHESSCRLMVFLRFIYPKANFVIYGDGSGLLMGGDTKLINPYTKTYDYKFFKPFKPNEVISIAPFTEDDSIDVSDIPIRGTDTDVLYDIVKNDEKIQEKVNSFINPLITKYSEIQNKFLLLMTKLEHPRFLMSEEEQINIYIDIIHKYCPKGSLVILKLHPTSSKDMISILKEHCGGDYIFEAIPTELKEIPVELYCNLIKKLNAVITFISSSKISLTLLYGINCFDAYDVVQNYPLHMRVNSMLKVYDEVVKRYKSWDKRSLVYQCNIAEDLKKFYEFKDEVPVYIPREKVTFLQKIFSITNWNNRKILRILGVKFSFKYKKATEVSL